MSDIAIEVSQVSRVFRRYRNPRYRFLELFGLPIPKKGYDEFVALKDIDFTVKRGERLALIGRNGAGKSTLLSIVCGRLQPSSGRVRVKGDIQALMELGTGFHPDFTARENVFASLAMNGITGPKARRLLDEIIDFAELEEFVDQPVKTFSAGMYARLAFSTSTAVEPDILIVDEVLGAGDAYFASKSAQRMRALTVETGATVLFVSHDMSSVERLCERAIWIHRGETLLEGSALDVSKAYYATVLKEEERRLAQRTEQAGARHNKKSQTSIERTATSTASDGEGSEEAETNSPEDHFSTTEGRISSITPENTEGEPSFVFSLGEDIIFQIKFELLVPVPTPWLALILYDGKGNRVFLGVEQLKEVNETGRYTLRAALTSLNLRQGDYVLSVDILKDFSFYAAAGIRFPFIAHWDRAVFFRVDEGYRGSLDLGLATFGMSIEMDI